MESLKYTLFFAGPKENLENNSRAIEFPFSLKGRATTCHLAAKGVRQKESGKKVTK